MWGVRASKRGAGRGARRSKKSAAGSWVRVAVEVTPSGVIVRLREGVVHMGVGLRFMPALADENRVAATLRCLTDKAARSGEQPRGSCEESFTGVRSGVRRAGDDGGI